MVSPWGEPNREKIWEDTRDWLQNHIVAWVLAFFVPGGGSVIATLFIPATMDFRFAALMGFVGGIAGLALLVGATYSIQSVLVFKKQRDEARKLCDEAQKLYEPIEELADIKTGDTMKGKDINVSLMFQQLKTNHLAVVTFDHCTLRGPCVVMPENCEFHACNMAGNVDLGATLLKREMGAKYYGVGIFAHCTFNFCNFENISFLLFEEEIKNWQSKIVKV